MHPSSVPISFTLSPPKPLSGMQPINSPRGKVVREQHYFPSVRPSLPPSLCPSRYLILNHWAKFNQACYITFPHGKVENNIIFPPTCPSRFLFLNTGRNSTKLVTPLPLMVRLRENNIIFPCARQSIYPSLYLLLNYRAELNQTCNIASPHGVREQHYFSVRPSSGHLSVTLSPPKPLGGIQTNSLHHFPSW